jgi:uncharacterized delta-60 repeat protein
MRAWAKLNVCMLLFTSLASDGVLAAAGEFDPSFNGIGFVREHDGDASDAGGLGIHSSGEIVSAGVYGSNPTDDLIIWRYRPDGSRDTSFGGTGAIYPMLGVAVAVSPHSLAIDQRERIVLLTADPRSYFVFRFNFDGSPDLSFGGSGQIRVPIGANIYPVTDVVAQPDNKVIGVGGPINPATGRYQFFVFRLQEDGNLDPSFGEGGRVWTPFLGYDRATGVALQPDGKIVVVGRVRPLDTPNFEFALARYTPSGELDDTFGDGGKVVFPILDDNLGRRVVIQPDGKIVIAGYTCEDLPGGDEYCYFGVARVDPNGQLDPLFGDGGKVHTEVGNGFPYDVTLQSDNKIVAVGIRLLRDFDVTNVVLVRYLPDGSLDPAFGDRGISETNYGYVRNAAAWVRIQADGQIVVNGGTGGVPLSNAVTARYFANGKSFSVMTRADWPRAALPSLGTDAAMSFEP